MFRRHPDRGPQQVAPKGCPCAGDQPRPQVLPKLPSPERRAGRGAGCAGSSVGSQASRTYSSWWQERDTEPWAGARSSRSRLPSLHTATSRTSQDRAGLRSRLLPPLLSTDQPWGSASRRPRPGQGQDPQRGVAEEDSLGALLVEFLPSRFRQFLHQLRQKCDEQPKLQTPRFHKCACQPRRSSSQCHTCLFLSDQRGRPSPHSQDNFRKILLHQIPPPSHQRGNTSQFTTGRNTSQLHSTQTPKAKTHNSSGEGLGFRRRCCPFRVRFADETLRDSALRYLERRCAVPSDESRTTLLPRVSDQVFGSVQKWLESLPKALPSRTKEEARTSAWCWDCPHLLPQELQGHLSEDASMKSRLPGSFTPRATTQRQRRALKTSLDTLNILDQESFLPNLVLQSILKRGRPKGYQLLLPSTILQRAHRSPSQGSTQARQRGECSLPHK